MLLIGFISYFVNKLFVLVQVPLLDEALAALLAVVRPLPAVRHRVPPQRRLKRELSWTHATFERHFPGVAPRVLDQLALVDERLGADLALEDPVVVELVQVLRVFARHVLGPEVPPGESLGAEAALEGPLTCVRPHVEIQGLFGLESFAAGFATEFLFRNRDSSHGFNVGFLKLGAF